MQHYAEGASGIQPSIYVIVASILSSPQYKLKSAQRSKVKQFMSITQCDENTAISCLSSHDWKLEIAVDGFFQNPVRYFHEKPVSVEKKKLNSLFERYRG